MTTYDSARSRLPRISQGDFDLVILDEAHKLRNLHGANGAPQIATQLHATLKQRLFKYVLMLTATPIQNRLWDLYSLIDCLTVAKGHKNPLGTPKEFSSEYIADGQAARQLRPGSRDKFRGILRQYLARTRRQDARLPFPERHVQMFRVPATSTEQQLQTLLAQNITGANALTQISLAVALMSSPHAFLAQLDNMSERNAIWTHVSGQARRIMSEHRGRFSKEIGLLELIGQLREKRPQDWRVVIFTTRKETQTSIGNLLRGEGVDYGFIRGGQADQNTRTIKAFMSNPPELSVVVSTDAGAEGVNLQQCNVLVNYDLPWNPMVVEQRIGRVQRLASQHKHVTVFNLCLANSPEERVVGRLMEKLQTICQTVGDIEAILESTYSSSLNTEESFTAQMRHLVVSSLLGQDIEQATRLMEESIVEGKRLLKENEEHIDQHLGQLEDLHYSGPPSPKLTRFDPTVPYRDFVLRSLATDDGIAHEQSEGLYEVSYSDRPNDVIVFDEAVWQQQSRPGVFLGRSPRLYMPGKPAFERLVQHWLDRGEHLLQDDSAVLNSYTREVSEKWLGRFEHVELREAVFHPESVRGTVDVVVKAVANNSVDSYEKLLHVGLDEETTLKSLARGLSSADGMLSPEKMFAQLVGKLREGVQADSDVQAFCEFYSKRLADEIVKAENQPELRKKLMDDFAPNVHCEVVALSGQLMSIGQIRICFTVDSKGEYVADIRATPLKKIVHESPLAAICQESKLRVPEVYLAKCESTGQMALAHLLTTSDETGRRCLSRLAVRCDASGKVLFADETGTCEVTKLRVSKSLLKGSQLSGRQALADRLVRCEFSRSLVLPSELEASQISGKGFRRDQRATSAVSGRFGHSSEFINCTFTGDPVLPEETAKSSVSGRKVRKDKLANSEKNPHRCGAPDEIAWCAISGKRLLLDEVSTSNASGKIVDADLLVKSHDSNERCLIDELVTCAESGAKVLPSELGISDFSGKHVRRSLLRASDASGRLGLAEEVATCEFTQSLVLADELIESEVSGKRFRYDEVAKSQSTGRIGHRSELFSCGITGAELLSDEVAKSALSGLLVDRRYLVNSEKSGRPGVDGTEEVVKCEVTAKRLLADEAGKCAVTNQIVDVDLLYPSELSGALMLPAAGTRCEVTGELLLPAETGLSAISGRRVRLDRLDRSQMSNRLGLESEFINCEFTKDRILNDEVSVSEASGKQYRHDQSATSEVSGKSGHRSEFAKCNYSGRLALIAELGVSEITKKLAIKSLLQVSDKSGRQGVTEAGEVVLCQETGKRLLRDEVGVSTVSGKCVDACLLVKSPVSGRSAIRSEFVRCEQSGIDLLPSEAGRCCLTGKLVDARLLQRSEISQLSALGNLLLRCAGTNKRVLPDELEKCGVTGQRVIHELLGECCVTHRRVLRTLLRKSDVSSRLLLKERGIATSPDGKFCAPDEVTICHWAGGAIPIVDSFMCSWTGLSFHKQHRGIAGQLSAFEPMFKDLNLGEGGAQLAEWLESQAGGILKRLISVRFVKSPGGSAYAFVCDVEKMLGLKSQIAAFIVKSEGGKRLSGHITFLKRVKQHLEVVKRVNTVNDQGKVDKG